MKRIPIVDFVRFASIFTVVGGHFFPRWIASGYPPWLHDLILDAFLNGPYGVTCFFVVSGFLITQMLAGSREDFSGIDLKAFYVRRAARIFPLMALTILTGWTLEHLKPFMDAGIQRYNAWGDVSGFGWGFWISLLTFNFNWYVVAKGGTAVGTHWTVLWSLAIEEQFYFLYPLALKKLGNPRRALGFLVGVALSAVFFRVFCYLYLSSNPRWIHQASFAAFDQIAIGGILYFLWVRLGKESSRRPWACFFLLSTGFLLCLLLYVQTSFDDLRDMILVPTLMAVACALLLLGGLHLQAFRSPGAAVLSWPGKLSYGCYLWHPTLMFLLLPLLARIGGLGALALLMTVIWTFAFFSYRIFEIPLNNRIRSWFGLKASQSL